MKNNKYSILALLIIFPISASATGYNYLPNDVYIKQQEEKAALEYRISTLETSLQNSPTLSILNIESRISQLEQEKQTEINYVTGLYAHNGIIVQLPSAIAKINAKYDGQISNLEQQIEEYEDAMSEEKDLKNEIKSLKSQLSKIEQQVSQPAPSVDDTSTVEVPSAVDMFDYIDSLSLDEASETYNNLRIVNPDLYRQVEYILVLKYPNGKPGSARHDEYLQTIKTPVSETVTNEIYIPPIAKKTEVFRAEKDTISEVATDQVQIPTSTEEIYTAPQEPTPEIKVAPIVEQPKTIWQSVVGFFKKLWF